jgi:hypothetical protein
MVVPFLFGFICGFTVCMLAVIFFDSIPEEEQ